MSGASRRPRRALPPHFAHPAGGTASGVERIALAGGFAFAACGFVLWCAGELSGRLATGRWPHVGPADAPAILVRFVAHPSRPVAAWPATAQHAIGPVALLYGIIVVIAAVLIAALWIALRIALHMARRRGVAGFGSRTVGARDPAAPATHGGWADRRALRPLVVAAPTPGRLSLGTSGRSLLAAEANQSVLVVGPTQSHKTSGFAIPALLEWEGPVVATSVKTDLVRETLAWRRTKGPVWVIDPAASTDLDRSWWTPLSGSLTWPGARRMATALASVATARDGDLSNADFWRRAAAKLLAPLLFAAATGGLKMADVVKWVDTQADEEPAELLGKTNVGEALRAAEAVWRYEDRMRSGVYATAESLVEAFAEPGVASGSGEGFRPENLLEGGTLYVCAPAHEQRRLEALFAGLVTQVLHSAYDRVSRSGRPLAPSMLVVLDEAAHIAPLAELAAWCATAAGHGVQLVTVWQDFAQVTARYGAQGPSVVNNHRAKIVLSGIADPGTLEQMSALVGEGEEPVTTLTWLETGARHLTEGSERRRLAPADALRRIAPGRGVLVYGHLPPVPITLRPWYRVRGLSARAMSGAGR